MLECLVYHVVVRGVRRGLVFEKDSDFRRYLDYLGRYAVLSGVKILAYCLMDNHIHLLVFARPDLLPNFLQNVTGQYAQAFNRSARYTGHVFESKCRSFVRWGDLLVAHTSRYIHLNPVVARMVKTPADYPWSSYPAFLGLVPAPSWLDTETVLRLFSRDPRQAHIDHQRYVESLCDDLSPVWRMSDVWIRQHPLRRNMIPTIEFAAMTSIALARSIPLRKLEASALDLQLYALKQLTEATQPMMAAVLNVSQPTISRRMLRLERILHDAPQIAARVEDALLNSLLPMNRNGRTDSIHGGGASAQA